MICNSCQFEWQDAVYPLATVMSVCPGCTSSDVSEAPRVPFPPPRPQKDQHFTSVSELSDAPEVTIPTGTVFDRITRDFPVHRDGGGVPLGCVILFSGPPGAGKSFQARELAWSWVTKIEVQRPRTVVYYSYEERPSYRLFISQGPPVETLLVTQSPISADMLVRRFWSDRELLVIIDSLQTASVGAYVPGEPEEFVEQDLGSIGSPRRCLGVMGEAMAIAHRLNATVLVIAQETKDDRVAGPRTVEHMADVVMRIEVKTWQESTHSRIVSISKNRRGPIGEWVLSP